MQIELNSTTEDLLKRVLASGHFHSVDEIIAEAAQRLLEHQSETPIARMPQHVSVDELASKQGVGPIDDFRKLRADFAPPNETVDDFLASIFEERHLDDPRVIQ